MNKKQIEALKKLLEENKESLQSTLESFAKKDDKPEGDWDTSYPKFDESKQGEEEEADEVEEYSSLLPIEHALETKLKKTNEALKKIDEEDYGICEKCGKEISYKKLKLAPETKECKDCN